MWTRYRNRDFFKHCACETQKDNKNMNTSTNTTQISRKMMQAQTIRRRTRGSSNNSVSGGITYSILLTERAGPCEKISMFDVNAYCPPPPPEPPVVEPLKYPPVVGPPDPNVKDLSIVPPMVGPPDPSVKDLSIVPPPSLPNLNFKNNSVLPPLMGPPNPYIKDLSTMPPFGRPVQGNPINISSIHGIPPVTQSSQSSSQLISKQDYDVLIGNN
jgi:hypothetical protein